MSQDALKVVLWIAFTVLFFVIFVGVEASWTIYSSMFRISTVMYGDEARTRVVYTGLNDSSWSNPHVIEFDPVFSEGAEAVSRADMYDYDFAVTALIGAEITDPASASAAGGSDSTERKVRVKIANPRYLEFSADTTALLAADAGDVGDDVDNSNGDFEYFSPEDWAEFFDFLYKMLVLYDGMELDECPETEISVLDAGLPIQNFGELHDGESSSRSSGGPGAGKGDGGGDGDGNGGGAGSAHRLADTGDHNLIGKLLFGEK